jgi:hypothetical protein
MRSSETLTHTQNGTRYNKLQDNRTVRQYIPEDSELHTRRRENLKSLIQER